MYKNLKIILILTFIFVNISVLFAENSREIWTYVMPGEESNISGNEPITDLCYFGGGISFKGELVAKSKFSKDAKKIENAKMHLVIVDIQNKGLVHFLISPKFKLMKKFLKDLEVEIENYDGVQIDFESIDKIDKENFRDFLKKIKKLIGDKTLSIALPARTSYLDDAFEYQSIVPIVDRIFIMAYDEHWSGSKPGPVASSSWCEKVAKYTASVIPKEKLIMGMPFYGRSWQDKKNDRALKFTTIQEMIKNNKNIKILDGVDPSLEYIETVKVSVFYDDPKSLLNKIDLYSSFGIKNIGFWRLGQESKEIWDLIKNKEAANVKQ